MTSIKPEPHAASPAHQRVAEAKRDSEAELGLLELHADAARFVLNARGIIDPCERETSAAVYKLWALNAFDSVQKAATVRNRKRFEGATNALLYEGREAFDLPTAEAYRVLHAARAAAGMLPVYCQAFLEGAASARAGIAAVPNARCPKPPEPSPPPADIVMSPGRPAHVPRYPYVPVPPPARVPFRQGSPRPSTMITVQMPSVRLGTPREATEVDRGR